MHQRPKGVRDFYVISKIIAYESNLIDYVISIILVM